MSSKFHTNDRKLFVDDIRHPIEFGWDVVRSYDAFVDWVNFHGMPASLSLDHDLSFEHYPLAEENPNTTVIPYDTYKEKTGYDCAKYIVNNGLKLGKWKCHSMNPVGRTNIEELLKSYEHISSGRDPRFK